MKIICIGRNYVEHIKELNSPLPEQPVFFMKGENALYYKDLPFFLPDYSDNIQYECELVLHICKVGKNIEERFANRYFDKITLGIDLTDRDAQKRCKERGEPWEIAKSFDFSAPIGEFIDISESGYPDNIDFHLELNGNTVQIGESRKMIFSFEKIIAHISKYITLKTGDIIFTGTPAGVGKLKKGDVLEAFLHDKSLLNLKIK